MSSHSTETSGYVPFAESPSVNIDPDFHLPADEGNGLIRAFRVLFPKAA